MDNKYLISIKNKEFDEEGNLIEQTQYEDGVRVT